MNDLHVMLINNNFDNVINKYTYRSKFNKLYYCQATVCFTIVLYS